ncbi:hypothetical protein GGI25_005639 [Coemansia spiralis]|uniref:Calcium-activated potassium channel BK alpha subunit domain-containing protein n=1 Tax=Coemansia spiralis TaxID=417178 RepID=A0A9W8KVJ8_9FUNG|nr:hypothetical protein GGI25_005639 [Coemansia spiralis]
MPELATFVGLDNVVNGWRQRMLFYIDTTIWGRLWEVIDFLLNFAFCIIYVVNTTVVDDNLEPLRIPVSNRLVEFLIALIFLGQYIARFVIINANHRTLEHVVVLFAFVAPITAYFMSVHNGKVRNSYMSAGVMVVSALGSDGSIPRSVFSEIISMAIVGLIAFAVPSRVTRLVDLALKTSAYTKTVALPTASRHALVCGCVELESIRQFLHEFFNADHGPNIFKTTIVILHPDEPSMEMKALLQDPVYTNRVFYVKGRATNFKALKKSRVDLATCVYILSRKHSHGSGIEEDAETVLIALALSAFSTSFITKEVAGSKSLTQPKFQVFAQTILPGSMLHMSYLQTTRVICVDEMRMGIMAQNCATPGFAALAFMLSKSVADHVDWDFSGVLAEAIAKSVDDSWVKTYIHGISQEIYQAHVPSSLIGKSFFKASRYFYRCHGLLVFCVGSYSQNKPPRNGTSHHPSIESSDKGYYQVLLSPRNYILEKHDMLFAISTDVQSVLNAMLYAERVSIRSTQIQKAHRLRIESKEKHVEVIEDELPTTPSTSSTRRNNFLTVLTTNGLHTPHYKRPVSDANNMPSQFESPRRIVAAKTPNTKNKRQVNYISDSDSSYFSPGCKIDQIVNTGSFPLSPSVKGAVRTRFERVARRNNTVPESISNHIVICDVSDIFPRNVELLIQSLKNAYEDDDLPVVILSPGDLDNERKLVINDFTNVYVVRGTPLAQSDLRRTRIEQAQKAIILGNCNNRQVMDVNETSTDSAAILSNMNIQSLCGGQFFVTTELLDIESIRYLDHTQLLGEPLLKRTFMGGHIFMPAMIDTALCQCYFSSHILDVLRHLTFSHSPSDRVQSTVATPKAEEADIIRSFKPGKLNLLYVPDRFIGKRYDTLVLTLMKQHGSIPLGIYRVVNHDGQAFASVMCNPPPFVTLLPSDAVYVLGPDISGWTHYSETLRNIQIASQTVYNSEAVSPLSATDRKADQSPASRQSRHTVYSHNTEEDARTKEHDVHADQIDNTIAADADADVSDVDDKVCGSFANETFATQPATLPTK